MFEVFNFRMVQLRGVKAVMDDFASFKPDDKTPAQVAAMVESGDDALDAAEGAWTDLNLARGTRDEKAAAGHDAVVDVYAVMKRRYRKDPGSFDSVCKLPIDDQSPAETLRRMKLTSKLWLKLPNPPGSATAFKAWDTMGRTEFDALITPLKDALDAEEEAEENWELANGELKELQVEIEDFVTTALVQGRAQYEEGTAERAAIEGIPTDGSGPSVPLPGKAVITDLTSPADGVAVMQVAATGATSFNVLVKAPGSTTFSNLAEEVEGPEYQATGFEVGGSYQFIVVGVNGSGAGEQSDAQTVLIAKP